MRPILAIAVRDLRDYRRDPGVYALAALLAASLALPAALSNAYDLHAMFAAAPWVLALIVPAFVARFWAPERASGIIRLLFSLPLRERDFILGKFLAGWAVLAAAIAAAFPAWIVALVAAGAENLRGPDLFAVLLGYGFTLLAAGGYAALAGAANFANSTAGAYALGVAACLGINLLSLIDVDAIAIMAPPTHLAIARQGVFDLLGFVYFMALILFGLAMNALTLEVRRGGAPV